jgi:membrane protein implicated in regulation of membrane protease activity
VKTSVVVLLLILGVVGAVVVALVMSFIRAHPQVGFALLVAIGVVALLVFLSAVYFLADRVHSYAHRIAQRRFVHRAELSRQEYDRVAVERVWDVECERMVIEQRKLDLEEQKIRLQAYQEQVVTVRHDHALVIRDYNGLGTRLAYEPVRDVGLVNTSQSNGLLSSSCCQISALDLLQDGQLDRDDLVLGFDEGGNLVRRTWRQLLSILILGLMGGGKTNTALWTVFQLLLKGYRVALIDRHAKSDESTHARLKDFVTPTTLLWVIRCRRLCE